MKVLLINLFISFLLIGVAHPQEHPDSTGSTSLANCGGAKADVMFLLDSSGSIRPTDYTKMLQFVVDITKNFDVGPGDVQFGAIAFSDSADVVIDLNDNADHASLEQAIRNINQVAGQTFTDKALELAREEAFTAAHGARPGVPQIAIILTDGESTEPTLTANEAAAIKQAGIHIVSVGVGTGADAAELTTLATTPDDMFQVGAFDVLDTIQEQLSITTCQIVETAANNNKPTCDAEADILFVVDASGSVGTSSYQQALNFIVNITRNFDLANNQFSTIMFSDNAYIVFDFGDYSDRSELEQKILSTPYPGSTTKTDLALQLAREQAFTAAHGARPNIQKMAIVFTDGNSDDEDATKSQDTQLHNTGVKVVSIGITDSVTESELLNIASDPNLMYRVASYEALQTIQNEIANVTCEVASQPFAQCDAQADILFVMDSSGSVQQGNFNDMLNFIVNIMRNFDVGPNKVQFGAIAFSDNPHTVFNLNSYADIDSLEQAILATPYEASAAYTGKALELARTSAFTAANGARSNVPQIVVVFTDGQSTDPADTKTQATALKATGAKVISIGIGVSYDYAELQLIASSPQDVLEVTGYDVLDTINQQLTNKTCDFENADTTNSTPQHAYTTISTPQNTDTTSSTPQDADTTSSTPLANCGGAKADVVFLLDSSGSILPNDYTKMLQFVVDITKNFDVGPNDVQFGAIAFSTSANLVIDLNDNADHASLEQAILNINQLAGQTFTNKALELAREEAFTAAHGARPGVPQIAVVLTDGESTDPPMTAIEAAAIKQAGIYVVSVGVGTGADAAELTIMASIPDDMFQVATFDVLDTIQEQLAITTCQIANNNKLLANH